MDQLHAAMVRKRDGEQQPRIRLVKHERIRERAFLVVEELEQGQVEHRLVAAVQKNLDARAGLFRTEDTDEGAVDATRPVHVQQHVAAIGAQVLEIGAVIVAAGAVPGARHGGV
jgi:hypothetical protein